MLCTSKHRSPDPPGVFIAPTGNLNRRQSSLIDDEVPADIKNRCHVGLSYNPSTIFVALRLTYSIRFTYFCLNSLFKPRFHISCVVTAGFCVASLYCFVKLYIYTMWMSKQWQIQNNVTIQYIIWYTMLYIAMSNLWVKSWAFGISRSSWDS